MNIIISPAKKMNINNDDFCAKDMPYFIDKTEIILNELSSLSYDKLKSLLCCNDDIASLNYNRYSNMDLESNLTPALFSYEGIQYKYMSPNSMTNEELDYVEKHLKILSAFYGVLTPFEGVVPYRLEMMAKFKTDFCNNLYDFWKDSLYQKLIKESRLFINLASKEYSKCIEKYLTHEDTFINIVFGSLIDGKIKTKATEAKMARGRMVRFMAENNIENIEDIKNFSDLGFTFSKEHSTDNKFVFIK